MSADTGREVHVLFVCLGNTDRSPMAEAIATSQAADLGLAAQFRSAGLDAINGDPATKEACAALENHGLDLSDHRAKKLTDEDVEWADRIFVMERWMLEGVETLGGAGKTELLAERDVDDPHRGTPARYERTIAELEGAIGDRLSELT